MECKCALSLALSDCGLELIETLWNVNTCAHAYAIYSISELIETLWNVNNVVTTVLINVLLGINRNIVECK